MNSKEKERWFHAFFKVIKIKWNAENKFLRFLLKKEIFSDKTIWPNSNNNNLSCSNLCSINLKKKSMTVLKGKRFTAHSTSVVHRVFVLLYECYKFFRETIEVNKQKVAIQRDCNYWVNQKFCKILVMWGTIQPLLMLLPRS